MEADGIDPQLPLTTWVSATIGEHRLTGFMCLFRNSCMVFIYQGEPRTGSIMMAPGDAIDPLPMFAGRNPDLASALSRILSRKLGLGVIASVYIERDVLIPLESMRTLIDELAEKGKSLISKNL